MGALKKILIVEDDHDVRVSYRKTLEEEGFVVHSAANGKNGLDLLRKKSSVIRLILLDINMPIMDGNEFLRIKSADPVFAKIPVVVITARPTSVTSPVDEIIEKPPSDLVGTVKKFFS